MNPETDRISIPTNGKGPREVEAPLEVESTGPGQLAVGFTPTQLAVGFGIIAALVALVVRRARRGS